MCTRSSHQCRDLLDEARDYHLMPERRPLLNSFKSKPRKCKVKNQFGKNYLVESRILPMEHKYPPPPLFWIFRIFLFLCLFQVRLGLPCRVRKEGQLGPPAGARIRKKTKIKTCWGGGEFLLQEHNTGRVPIISVQKIIQRIIRFLSFRDLIG